MLNTYNYTYDNEIFFKSDTLLLFWSYYSLELYIMYSVTTLSEIIFPITFNSSEISVKVHLCIGFNANICCNKCLNTKKSLEMAFTYSWMSKLQICSKIIISVLAVRSGLNVITLNNNKPSCQISPLSLKPNPAKYSGGCI